MKLDQVSKTDNGGDADLLCAYVLERGQSKASTVRTVDGGLFQTSLTYHCQGTALNERLGTELHRTHEWPVRRSSRSAGVVPARPSRDDTNMD